MVLLATIGGIAVLILWGISDYCLGKGGQATDAYQLNVLAQWIGTVALMPFFFWHGAPAALATGPLLLVLLVSILLTVAFIAAVKAFAIGPFGVATPIANASSLVTLLITVLLFGQTFAAYHLVALCVVLGGVVMLAIDRDTFDRKKFHGSAVYYAGIAALFWGAGFALYNLAAKDFFWLDFAFLLNACMAVLSVPLYLAVHRAPLRRQEIGGTALAYAAAIGTLGVAGMAILFATATYTSGIVIPFVIASAAPLVTSLIAYWRDGERIAVYKRAGAIVLVAGLMLLNVV